MKVKRYGATAEGHVSRRVSPIGLMGRRRAVSSLLEVLMPTCREVTLGGLGKTTSGAGLQTRGCHTSILTLLPKLARAEMPVASHSSGQVYSYAVSGITPT